jgi:hypothetical protein
VLVGTRREESAGGVERVTSIWPAGVGAEVMDDGRGVKEPLETLQKSGERGAEGRGVDLPSWGSLPRSGGK